MDVNAWDRLPSESAKAYAAFSLYLEMDTARKALVKLGKAHAKKSVGQTLAASERPVKPASGALPGTAQ